MIKKISILFFFCFMNISCEKNDKPEQVLRSFVNKRFEKILNVKALLDNTTGEFKENLQSMNEEETKLYAKAALYNKKGLKVISKKCSKTECKIAYIISFEDKNKSNPFKTDVRNEATLLLVEDEWKISEIRVIKSYIESKKDIEPMAQGEE